MKIAIRTFVVALALTGAAASAHITASAKTNPDRIQLSKTSDFPVPVCPPDDPNACGFH